ncbi:MAG: peptidylprolyl isomerase [Albidovulum sp.]|nr:peptidylprolyl isomerase [Albidovulum sp.]
MKNILAAASIAAVGAGYASADSDTLVVQIAGEANGVVEIELFSETAPLHVERIKSLARDGLYDNVVFHRVIDGFMAQTGDVRFGVKDSPSQHKAGMGGSELANLPAEFSDIPYVRGIVGMARAADPDSANSQFFIMFEDAPFLDGNYTVVGKVISGQEVVDAIRKGDPKQNGTVVGPDYMASVQIKEVE